MSKELRLEIRLTESLNKKLNKIVEQDSTIKNKSSLIRRLVQNYRKKQIEILTYTAQKEMQENYRHLAKLGGNINQIAHHLNFNQKAGYKIFTSQLGKNLEAEINELKESISYQMRMTELIVEKLKDR